MNLACQLKSSEIRWGGRHVAGLRERALTKCSLCGTVPQTVDAELQKLGYVKRKRALQGDATMPTDSVAGLIEPMLDAAGVCSLAPIREIGG